VAELIEMLFGLWAWVHSRKHVLDVVQVPLCEGAIFSRKDMPGQCPTTPCHEVCKNGWMYEDAIWVVDSRWSKEACVHSGHIGAIWQMRLNHPCAVAMQPYVKVLW